MLIDLLSIFSWRWDYVLFKASSLNTRKDQYLFPVEAHKCLLSGSQSVVPGPTASALLGNLLKMHIPGPLHMYWIRHVNWNIGICVLTSSSVDIDQCWGVRITILLKGKKARRKKWVNVKLNFEVHTLTLLSEASSSGKLSLTPLAHYKPISMLRIPFWYSHIPLLSNYFINLPEAYWLLIYNTCSGFHTRPCWEIY